MNNNDVKNISDHQIPSWIWEGDASDLFWVISLFITSHSFVLQFWFVRVWKSSWGISLGGVGWNEEDLIWLTGRLWESLWIKEVRDREIKVTQQIKALVAQWLWCFSHEPEALCQSIIVNKYDPHPSKWD